MSKLKITMACAPYDRVLALSNGMVVPEGIDLNYLPLTVEEVFWRQLMHTEFDVSESSLSQYTMLRDRGDDRFIAIPVFPSRFFRHSCIFINTHKGIREPQDFKGKTVGVPEFQMSAAVWMRGAFQDDYGVFPRDISWCSGGEEHPGRVEKIPMNLPPDVRWEPIPADKTLSGMLDTGEIDAMITARMPSCFAKGSPNVARFFPNYREVEEDYYRRTGIFPIMHTIILNRRVYEANRWIAMSLYKAFCQAKEFAYRNCNQTVALHVTLPWVMAEVERTRQVLGEDWWSYGLEKNRHVLETFLKYHHEQGLSSRRMTIEDLFTPETIDEFKV